MRLLVTHSNLKAQFMEIRLDLHVRRAAARACRPPPFDRRACVPTAARSPPPPSLSRSR